MHWYLVNIPAPHQFFHLMVLASADDSCLKLCDFIRGRKMVIFWFYHSLYISQMTFFCKEEDFFFIYRNFLVTLRYPSYRKLWSPRHMTMSTTRLYSQTSHPPANQLGFYWQGPRHREEDVTLIIWNVVLDRSQVFQTSQVFGTTQEPRFQSWEISSEPRWQQRHRPGGDELANRGQEALVFQIRRRQSLGIREDSIKPTRWAS